MEEDREEYWNNVITRALGPLGLRHSDLWEITLGELADLDTARRKVEMQRVRELALQACWIANGSGMRSTPLQMEDLIGFEDPETGETFNSKWAYHAHCKEKILSRKRGVE